ncbi:hypothetical protein DVH24_027864, partial [Malus domestica]
VFILYIVTLSLLFEILALAILKAEGPGRGDEDLCREGARTCTSHIDVRPPNLATSTSSCSTFDLRATLQWFERRKP